jgi:FKBP-type peptidyl-prolyl cis-trans isomerase 2
MRMNDFVEVGAIVTCPSRPDWGRGQVQSVIGARVTVNFEHAGKVVINADEVPLTVDTPDWM